MRYLSFEDMLARDWVRSQRMRWHETLEAWQQEADSWWVAPYDPQPIVLPNGVRFFATSPKHSTAGEPWFEVLWHLYSPNPGEYAALHAAPLSVSTTFAMVGIEPDEHELNVYLTPEPEPPADQR